MTTIQRITQSDHRSFIYKCFSYFIAIVFLIISIGLAGCSSPQFNPHFHESTSKLPKYKSQKIIKWQSYATILSPYGGLPAVVFGYDRNNDSDSPKSNSMRRKGIDTFEAKLINSDGYWVWYPFLILSDDDYDGIIDRLFLDSNLDCLIDAIYDIRDKNLTIDGIEFQKFSPWRISSQFDS